MRKQISLSILIVANLLLAQSLIAQTDKLVFSVFGALSKSSIVGESDSWKDPIGGMGGVTVAKFLNEEVSVRLELNLSMQGAKWEEDWGEGLTKGRTNMLYLNVPLVVRYQLESGFFGEAGIQPGFLLSAKDKYNGLTEDYSDYVKKFDFSFPIGVGYEFINNFGVGIRVIPGITNVNEGEDVSKDRNFVVAVRATYTFE